MPVHVLTGSSVAANKSAPRVVLLALLFILSLALLGQAQPGPMTNADIIALVEGGLGPSVLVAAIGRAEAVAFDVDRGLLDLARAGVPDEVITAMIEKQTAQDEATAAETRAEERAARPSPGIYLVQENGTERLEPTAYAASSASGWRSRLTLGIARDQSRATLPRMRSQVRSESDRPKFRFVFPDLASPAPAFQGSISVEGGTSNNQSWWSLVGAHVTNPNQFALAQMDAREGRRELIVGQVNAFGVSAGPRGEDMRSFEYELVEPGIYEVSVTEGLVVGEYCFFPILAGNVTGDIGGAGYNQIFDFGVGP